MNGSNSLLFVNRNNNGVVMIVFATHRRIEDRRREVGKEVSEAEGTQYQPGGDLTSPRPADTWPAARPTHADSASCFALKSTGDRFRSRSRRSSNRAITNRSHLQPQGNASGRLSGIPLRRSIPWSLEPRHK